MSTPSGPPSYSTAEVAQRLGVSIPTVQRWVDAGHLKAWKTMGGHRRIEAESAELLFASRLPVAAEQAMPAAGDSPLSIMVVDDNPDDRDILAVLIDISCPGALLRIEEGPIQALLAIGQAPPDILITDILMPHMNGIEMLRQLTSQGSLRPEAIIAVSSKTVQQLSQLGRLPDGVQFAAKPLDHVAFIAQLQAVAKTVAQAVRPAAKAEVRAAPA